MKAGQTDVEVGTHITIVGIKGEDKDLNGMTGTVTHPFAFGHTGKDWIGIHLDPKIVMPWGSRINVKVTEIKIIEQ